MPDIFQYHNYRHYLCDWFEEKKRSTPFFSYRSFANRVGMDAGNLVKILQHGLHISKRKFDAFCTTLKLKPRETTYFKLLIEYAKARKPADVSLLFERILAMQRIASRRVEPHQYEYYRQWYHTAITALLDFYGFDGTGYEKLAAKLHPPITPAQARESVDILHKLRIIEKDNKGFFRPVHPVVTAGEKWHSAAIRRFQEQTLQLGLDSLKKDPKADRDISMVTATLSADELSEVKDLASRFREEILKIAKASTTPEKVYQVNIQIFPLTEKAGGDQV